MNTLFLVFIDNDFYGNTRSKKVAKQIKNTFSKVHVLHINEYNVLPAEFSHMDSDEYSISIYELTDKFGDRRQVISTENEQEEAARWINNIIDGMIGSDNNESLDLFHHLPFRIKRHLGNYEPIDMYRLYDDSMDPYDFCDDRYKLTYEGFLLYLKRRELYEHEKSLRMLSEGLPD